MLENAEIVNRFYTMRFNVGSYKGVRHLNLHALEIGILSLLIIGIWHSIVIKGEYLHCIVRMYLPLGNPGGEAAGDAGEKGMVPQAEF